MLSKTQISLIRSLDRKKAREETGCFIAEGDKIVSELLELPTGTVYKIRSLYGTEAWLKGKGEKLKNNLAAITSVSESDLLRISHLKTPNQVLALVDLPPSSPLEIDPVTDLIIGLDQIQDPGNAGTIIRLADWFGITGILFSPDSADIYSPKVVQSSMGSVFRVKTVQSDMLEAIQGLPAGFPVYGTGLTGENVYHATLSRNGMILLGNESKGLDRRYLNSLTRELTIPQYSSGGKYIDSLNVAIAAALICSEFRRQSSG